MSSVDDRQFEALEAAISVDRLGTYLRATAEDHQAARQLYVWDRDLSAALFADIAIIEVALRNAVHRVLSASYGERWYEPGGVPLDIRAIINLQKAWERLPAKHKKDISRPDLPGKLVARLMFGFWRDLFDAGGYIGKEPRRERIDNEQTWRLVLSKTFPGGRTVARETGEHYTRDWALHQIDLVHALRNRVAHHEPLIRGFPLPGQDEERRSAAEGYEACIRLARMIDFDLAAWLQRNSGVPDLLARRPVPKGA